MSQQNQENEFWRSQAMKWMGVGIEFCVVVLAFAAGGYFLDGYFDCEPGFTIIGFLIGFALMIYSMLKRAGGIK
ncbi:MAG: AtpZ/AtpI family protein [Anaerohalosphaera sp.]|nr:AtpZ/AtpI family protein [Anaerohalosphaera sp.]